MCILCIWDSNARGSGYAAVQPVKAWPFVSGFKGKVECVQPYALNAATLATCGVDTLGGVLRRGLPFDAGWPPANRLLGALTARDIPVWFAVILLRRGLPVECRLAAGQQAAGRPPMMSPDDVLR